MKSERITEVIADYPEGDVNFNKFHNHYKVVETLHLNYKNVRLLSLGESQRMAKVIRIHRLETMNVQLLLRYFSLEVDQLAGSTY